MFELENILNYATMNIQTIGIFIAIIGGLIVTKLLNLKIEKDTLEDKLNIINKQILYDNERIKKRKKKITNNKRLNFIDSIYDHVLEEDFNLEKYDKFGLSEKEIEDIYNEVIEGYKNAYTIFKDLDYYLDDVESILSDRKIYDTNDLYWIYYKVGCDNAKITTYSMYSIPNVGNYRISSNIASLQENLEERDLAKSYEELNELKEWRLIEKENVEIKIKAINSNLKVDFFTFGIVTIFGIVVPQIVISIHPLFIKFKFLKYVFAVYSILSFVVSMILMINYIYKMYKEIKK